MFVKIRVFTGMQFSYTATFNGMAYHSWTYNPLNPTFDTLLFATTANPLQLYHSPRAKILAFKSGSFSPFESSEVLKIIPAASQGND